MPRGLEPSHVFVRPVDLQSGQLLTWNAETTVVPGDLVFAVPFKQEVDWLNNRHGSSSRAKVVVVKPQYELAFVATLHKSQGRTLKKAVISVLDRPMAPSRANFHALYVGLTRVKCGDDLRILGDVRDLDFVSMLQPPVELLAFFEGYDPITRLWDRERALKAFPEVERRLSSLRSKSSVKKRRWV